MNADKEERNTLRDFQMLYDGDYCYVDKDELRAEAIKWIKYMRSDNFDFEIVGDPMEAVPWIKMFFNITEEELK